MNHENVFLVDSVIGPQPVLRMSLNETGISELLQLVTIAFFFEIAVGCWESQMVFHVLPHTFFAFLNRCFGCLNPTNMAQPAKLHQAGMPQVCHLKPPKSRMPPPTKSGNMMPVVNFANKKRQFRTRRFPRSSTPTPRTTAKACWKSHGLGRSSCCREPHEVLVGRCLGLGRSISRLNTFNSLTLAIWTSNLCSTSLWTVVIFHKISFNSLHIFKISILIFQVVSVHPSAALSMDQYVIPQHFFPKIFLGLLRVPIGLTFCHKVLLCGLFSLPVAHARAHVGRWGLGPNMS